MKKILLSLAITTAITGLIACDSADPQTTNNQTSKNTDKATDSLEIKTIKKPITQSSLEFSTFDWAIISKSKADDVTTIQLPEGMKLVGIAPESPSQVSNFLEAITLNLYNGKNAYSETGDLAFFNIAMMEDGEVFDKALFDTETAEYMKSLGAVELFDGIVPTDIVTELKSIEGTNSYEYMIGETETAHLRQYALNHEDGIQSFYQIVSDDTHGQMGILELISADATEEYSDASTAPTLNSETTKTEVTKATKPEATKMNAEKSNTTEAQAPLSAKNSADMKAQLDANGKAILNIHFDPAKSTIKAKNRKIIKEIYILLTDNPELKLSIEGHTDDVGNADYNLRLSKKRAESVKKMLVQRGVDSNRLKTEGLGETKPMIPNSTMNNREANRRVELVQFN